MNCSGAGSAAAGAKPVPLPEADHKADPEADPEADFCQSDQPSPSAFSMAVLKPSHGSGVSEMSEVSEDTGFTQ